jgi:hypothetical protein
MDGWDFGVPLRISQGGPLPRCVKKYRAEIRAAAPKKGLPKARRLGKMKGKRR